VKKETIEAYRTLAHNIRHDLVHFAVYQRECAKLILHIEESLNAYRDVIGAMKNGDNDTKPKTI